LSPSDASLRQPPADRWRRLALRLVVATMAYNTLEAAVAVWAGVAARSIALVGFGLDSVIEWAAAGVVLWNLRAEARGAAPDRRARTGHRARRFVGATFLLLAVYVTAQAAWILWTREGPAESPVGILLAVLSLAVMPLVAWGKLRAARGLDSAALRAEARETLACSYLSFTLLLGLAANAVAGWWWADPLAALAMVPWLLKEGRENLENPV
jgi:divalent metal cation (Fe/Co/Zn/Cd) transporter